MMRFRIFGLAGAAVLALALNGCGSSDERPEPTPVEMAASALEMAQMALMALEAVPADATDEQRLAAEQEVLEAAEAHLDALEADATTPHGDVAAARMEVANAQAAVDATQMRVDDANAEATQRQQAIADSRMTLMGKKDALSALSEDATDEERLAAEQEVLNAAQALLALLEADATIPEGDVAAARMEVANAQAATDATQMRVDDANAEATQRQQAIADSRMTLMGKKDALSALSEDATDEERLAAEQEVLNAAQALLALLEADATIPEGDVAAARMEVANAQAATDATQMRVDDANAEATQRQQAIADSRMTLMGKKDALSALSEDATDEERLAAEQEVLNAANALLSLLVADPNTTHGDVDAVRMAVADAQAVVDATQKKITDDAADAQAAVVAAADAKTADALAHAMAIMVNANANNMAPFHSMTPNMNYMVGTERKSSGPAMVTVTDQMGDADAMDDKKLEDGSTPHTISGWHGAGFMRSGDKIPTEYVTVYTDIETPTPTKFTSVYPFDANPDPDGNNENRSLTFNTVNLPMAMSTEFPSTPSTKREFLEDDAGTPNENEGAVMGTFDGAPGTFECVSTGCSIETDDDGALEDVRGTWRFTPDKGAMVNVADGDYLHFGYWLESTENDDGTSSYKFQAFSGGGMAFDGGAVENVHGTAEYSGSAGGMYVRKILDPNGSVDLAAEGSFTANARLRAHFGGEDVAVSEQYRISGTVSEFMDGDTSLDGWTVKLDEAKLVNDDNIYSNEFTSTTEGSMGVDAGQWRGMFYGPSGLTPDTTDVASAVVAPSSVAGEFNAHFTNGHVHGGFGASKEE